MFLVLTLTILLILIVRSVVKTSAKRKLASKWPGAQWLPIVGTMYLYLNKKPEELIKYIWETQAKYGRTYRLWVGDRLAFFTTNPGDAEPILSSQKHIEKNDLYNVLLPWLGNGLLLSSGQKWFNKRRTITPTFHFKILEQFVEVFNRKSDILVEKLEERADLDEEFDIYAYITLFALDVISETAMGTEINAQTNTESEYVRAVQEVSYLMATRFTKVWQRVDFLFNLTAAKRRQDAAIKVLHDFTYNIIQSRRNMCATSDLKFDGVYEDAEIGSKKKLALLDVLLHAKINDQPLTDEEIKEEVDTFMFEGHDTTTGAICFTVYLLSKHPGVQEKLFEELCHTENQNQTGVTYRYLQNLKYLELVIKESLRLYPPVPIIGRIVQEDVNVNGRVIPAHSKFNIGIYHMHRDPDLFPNPEQFRPERFDSENTFEVTNPYVFVPFSAGPRNCIGQKFAMLELKSAIAKLVRNFEILSGSQEPEVVIQLTLKSRNGIYVKLKQRVKE